VLGLAFSWGALMGWAAAFGRLDAPALLLYAGSILWVIGYDTIYAHQDREDDAIVGVRSTALLFGERTPLMLTLFYGGAVALFAATLVSVGVPLVAWLGLGGFAAHLAWQVRSLDIGNPDLCLRLFKSNRDAGLILLAGLVAASLARAFALG
jgi:4-hydroxybenzoate polyprenyltransferase